MFNVWKHVAKIKHVLLFALFLSGSDLCRPEDASGAQTSGYLSLVNICETGSMYKPGGM